MVLWEQIPAFCSLYIDEKVNDTWRRLYTGCTTELVPFHLLDQVTVKVTQICQETGLPESWERLRGENLFWKQSEVPYKMHCLGAERIQKQQSRKAASGLAVTRRLHWGWQGNMQWKEKDETETFIRITDFLLLLYIALEEENQCTWMCSGRANSPTMPDWFGLKSGEEGALKGGEQMNIWDCMKAKDNEKISLLDFLKLQVGCGYLSDLPVSTNLPRIQYALRSIVPEEYSLWEWNDAVQYITRQKVSFKRQSDAVNYLLKYPSEKKK